MKTAILVISLAQATAIRLKKQSVLSKKSLNMNLKQMFSVHLQAV